jgi:chondroitin 4-sulfotransferase 11
MYLIKYIILSMVFRLKKAIPFIIAQVMQQQTERLNVYVDYCLEHEQPAGNVYDMYVIDNYQLLFCRLPKVGSTNWRRVLIHMATNESYDALLKLSGQLVHSAYELKILSPSRHFTTEEVEYRLEKYYKIVFVRHPLDRLLSAYRDKFVSKSMKQLYLSDYGYGVEIVRSCRNATWPSARAPDYVTFGEFLCYVTTVPVSQLNIHWRPYWTICNFCQAAWSYDFIGKYETMTTDAQYLFDQWGLKNVAFPPGYRSEEEHRASFRAAYSDVPSRLVDAVWDRYRPDFEMFGYLKYPDFY